MNNFEYRLNGPRKYYSPERRRSRIFRNPSSYNYEKGAEQSEEGDLEKEVSEE